MKRKEEIERLKRVISIRNGMINDLHEMLGAEHQRAETFKKEADLWQQKATSAANEAAKLLREGTKILQQPKGEMRQTPPLEVVRDTLRQLTTDVRMLKGMVEGLTIAVGTIEGLLLREAEVRQLAGDTDEPEPDRLPRTEADERRDARLSEKISGWVDAHTRR